jgi:hypothetical protein
LHFGGDKNILSKPSRVMGRSEETGKEMTIFQYTNENIEVFMK